jgi:hypothetical protein
MRINPRRNLADVSCPQQQAVAGNFCFRGVFPQSGNENLTPTHEFDLSLLAVSLQFSAVSLHAGFRADGCTQKANDPQLESVIVEDVATDCQGMRGDGRGSV